MAKSKKNKGNSLKSGRPPVINGTSKAQHRESPSMTGINARKKSSKATRTLINTHHLLQKSRASAVAAGNEILVKDIDQQIQSLGGLEAYQAASLTGQDRDRGGDSSEKLVEWLREYGLLASKSQPSAGHNIRVLEIGALSSKNAISSMIGKGVESVTRIDLHSQEPGLIQEVDFMDLPIPKTDAEKFDIISLSLVLNYVPDIAQRGEMLRRTTYFLRRLEEDDETSQGQIQHNLPQLFIVLPLPCLSNSRYTTHDHFVEIMASLQYTLIEHHDSQKLSYMLFRWNGSGNDRPEGTIGYRKIEINPGKSRNNFAIVLNQKSD